MPRKIRKASQIPVVDTTAPLQTTYPATVEVGLTDGDMSNLVVLRAMGFALPVEFEDFDHLIKLVRGMKWSCAPDAVAVDVYSHDGKNVRLTIFNGRHRHIVEYVAT